MNLKVELNNAPEKIKERYVVGRYVDCELWYFGAWDNVEIAKEVAIEIGNGIVLENDWYIDKFKESR